MQFDALIWLALGIALMGLEILVPGFVLFWFGLGGILTALLIWLKILPGPLAQSFFFFGSSLIFLALYFLVYRRYFYKNTTADDRDPTLTELLGTCLEPIAPGRPGKIKLHKAFHSIAEWHAESSENINKGDEIRVLEANGVSLIVGKIESEILNK